MDGGVNNIFISFLKSVGIRTVWDKCVWNKHNVSVAFVIHVSNTAGTQC